MPSFAFTRNDKAITKTNYIKMYQTYALTTEHHYINHAFYIGDTTLIFR